MWHMGCLFIILSALYVSHLVHSSRKFGGIFFPTCIAGVCFRYGLRLQSSWDAEDQVVLRPVVWIPLSVIACLLCWMMWAIWPPLFLVCILALVATLWCILRYDVVIYRVGFAEFWLILITSVIGLIFFDTHDSIWSTPPSSSPTTAASSPPPTEPRADADPPPPVVSRTEESGGPPAGPVDPNDEVLKPLPNRSEPLDAPEKGQTYLSDLKEFDFVPGPTFWGWRFGKNGDLGDNVHSLIQVSGKKFHKGLGMHPPDPPKATQISYPLNEMAQRFKGAVGLCDGSPPSSPVRFEVLGDGRSLWKSARIQKLEVAEAFDIDVKGVKVLQLRVWVDGNNNTGCHAVWLDPYVLAE